MEPTSYVSADNDSQKMLTVPKMLLNLVRHRRQEQLQDGHFDCFGRASQNFCDQMNCAYHMECLSISLIAEGL